MTKHFLFYATPGDKTIEKIWSFLSLPQGWCFGHGSPAAYLIAIYAANIVSLLNSYEILKTDAFPAEDGSILVTGYVDDYTVEVYCETNGSFEFVVEHNDEETEHIPCDSIESVWQELKQRIYQWRRSRDCSTQNIMTKQSVVTEAQRFNHPAMAAGHPLLIFSV